LTIERASDRKTLPSRAGLPEFRLPASPLRLARSFLPAMVSVFSLGFGSAVIGNGAFGILSAVSLVLVLAALLLGLGMLLGGVTVGRVQASAYECGFDAFGVVGTGHAVGFEVYALAFLLFDVEAVLLFPVVGVELPFLSLGVAVEFVAELALGIGWFLMVVSALPSSPAPRSSVLPSARLASSSLGGVAGGMGLHGLDNSDGGF
jgi:NADH:ubiquinone oxidoreductase subunit 3 (subunit A)